MSPGRNKPGPGTIRAFASAGLAGVGWPARPARPARPVLAGGSPPPVCPGPDLCPPLSRLDSPRRTPIKAPQEAIQPFFRPGARKGQGRLFSPLSARQGEVSLPDHRPALCQSPSGPTRVGVAHTLTSAPTAQLIRSGLTPEPRPAINVVGTGANASAAPKSSGLHSGLHSGFHSGLHSGFHRPGPDLSPAATGPCPSSWTGALANLSPHYAPSGRLTGCASLLDAMGVSGRAMEDLSLVDCGGLRFLAEGGATRPGLLRPLPGADRPVRIRRRIRGREEDGVI